jgi:DNA-directed RNA polymerase specialized sigma24 family protein
MTVSGETLSLAEVGRLLSRLKKTDMLRLAALARNWASGLPRRDAADLLNEALTRVLSGQRPWPADVPLSAFLSQVMRSIASQWRHDDIREPMASDLDVRLEEAPEGRDLELADMTTRMRASLRDDKQALGVFDQILLESSRAQACAELNIDATGYDTARRRMIRTLKSQYNPGWLQ